MVADMLSRYYSSSTLHRSCSMSTIVATTLKISGDLKRRVVAAAKAADKSPHAFMLEAIEHQTRLDEERRAFVANGVAACSEALKSGQGFPGSRIVRFFCANGSPVKGHQ